MPRESWQMSRGLRAVTAAYGLIYLGLDDLGRRDFGSWPVPEFRTVLERCVDWAVTGAFAS